MINIEKVKNKKQLKDFVNFSYDLYAKNPYYVPGLRTDDMTTLTPNKNPAHEHCDFKCFLAYRNGQVVGRIAAIINHLYEKKWHRKNGRFGFVDFIDDIEVARALFDAAEQYCAQGGCEAIHGPLGFCDLDPEGMLTYGFDQTGTFTTLYNHPYYPDFLQKLGYEQDVEWVESIAHIPPSIPRGLQVVSDYAKKRNPMHFMQFKNRGDIQKIAPKIFDLINVCFSELYGVVELTPNQIDYYVKQYFTLLDPKFVRVICNDTGDPIAFGLGFPSLVKTLQKHNGKITPMGLVSIMKALRHPKRLELLLIGVRPDYQKRGLGAVLLVETILMCRKYGIETVDLNPQLVTNQDIRGQWKYFDMTLVKRRAAFIKSLKSHIQA